MPWGALRARSAKWIKYLVHNIPCNLGLNAIQQVSAALNETYHMPATTMAHHFCLEAREDLVLDGSYPSV